MQAYSDPKREDDPHALPDVEVFYIDAKEAAQISKDSNGDDSPEPGWYWWTCLPGCLPDSEPFGPFATEAEALADAQEGSEEE